MVAFRKNKKTTNSLLQNANAKVDFFIVGVQKGGTTALDKMLRKSQEVQMSKKKEIHFFDNEYQSWSKPSYERLHRYFDWKVEGARRGEATPIYSYWPNSLERIAKYNPDAKIILCLRHPAFRAHSHWRMESKREKESLPFGEAIRMGRDRVGECHRVFSYVERGFYASQIRRIKALFDNVHIIRSDKMWSDLQPTLQGLCDFLEIPVFHFQREYIAPVETRGMAQVSREELAYLSKLYSEDIRASAALSGLNLDDWLDPDYSEPMPS